MIPETLQVLHRFPISAHGKVDLTQLPSGFSDATLVVNHSPLLGTLEQELGRMWSEVLGVDAIGADNDFFALGGDSLSAVRMLTRLQRLFNLAISLREFFGARTVRNLASLIARSDSGADPH
jgi:acyl carrier protein